MTNPIQLFFTLDKQRKVMVITNTRERNLDEVKEDIMDLKEKITVNDEKISQLQTDNMVLKTRLKEVKKIKKELEEIVKVK